MFVGSVGVAEWMDYFVFDLLEMVGIDFIFLVVERWCDSRSDVVGFVVGKSYACSLF